MNAATVFYIGVAVGALALSTWAFDGDLPALVYALVTLGGVVYYG